ncbi:MAG: HAD family hydrolase, partial [Gammaproteobacteria bacterium]
MTEIRLITFDLDNTLWDVGQVIRHAEERMHELLDELVPSYRELMHRDMVMEIRASSLAERPELAHDVSALREDVLYRGIRHCGVPDSSARQLARDAFQRFLHARQEVVLFEHALES